MAMAEVIAGIVKGAVNSGYSIYQDQRDYWQQKATQDTIWRREDNAVQRRAADLEKAGLNKNLAAGSAAGAGSVVSRSSSKNVELGSVLDVLQQVELLKRQREDTKRAKAEADMAQTEKKMLDNQQYNISLTNALDKANLFYQMGLNPLIYFDVENHGGYADYNPKVSMDFNNLDVYNSSDSINSDEVDPYHVGTAYIKGFHSSPFFNSLNSNYSNILNSSSILQLQQQLAQKDYDNYDTDKAFERVGSVIRDIGSIGGLANSIYNTSSQVKNRSKPRQKVTEQYKRRGYTRTESYEY